MIDSQKAMIDEKKAIIGEKQADLDEQQDIINEQQAMIDELKAMIDSQKAIIDEQKAIIDKYEQQNNSKPANKITNVTRPSVTKKSDLQPSMKCYRVGHEIGLNVYNLEIFSILKYIINSWIICNKYNSTKYFNIKIVNDKSVWNKNIIKIFNKSNDIIYYFNRTYYTVRSDKHQTTKYFKLEDNKVIKSNDETGPIGNDIAVNTEFESAITITNNEVKASEFLVENDFSFNILIK